MKRMLRGLVALSALVIAASAFGCTPMPAQHSQTEEPGAMAVAPQPAETTQSAPGEPAEAEAKPQTICPVMGWEIDKDFYVDHEGKRVYFCCSICTKRFGEEPDRYLRVIEEQGVTLEDAPQG